MDDLPEAFDVAITDTSLVSSILAAALAKAGKRVLHVDPQDHYGAQDAAYNLQELIDWAACANGPVYADIQCSHAFANLPLELQQQSRRFAISLAPVLVPAVSTFVDTLISSGVSHYAGFRLLESLALADRTGLRRIPTSKEDVFKSSDMSLIDKRRLMKFLQFAMGDWEAALLSRYPAIGDLLSSHFRLAGPLLNATMYGFMGCHSKEEDTVSALQRLGRFLTSSGRYGTSPFLVAQYGGLNEILQGFCRVSAVHGGLYILGRSVEVTTKDAIHHLSLSSQDSEDALHFSADLVVAQQPLQSAATAPTAHGILISKAPIRLESTASTAVRHSDLDVPTDERAPEVQQAESGLIVFPPGENGSPVSCVMHGENIYSSPAGYYVIYLGATNQDGLDPSALFQSALDILRQQITFEGDPFVFKLFFNSSANAKRCGVMGSGPLASLPDVGISGTADQAVGEATRLFHEIMGDRTLPLFSAQEAPADDA